MKKKIGDLTLLSTLVVPKTRFKNQMYKYIKRNYLRCLYPHQCTYNILQHTVIYLQVFTFLHFSI